MRNFGQIKKVCSFYISSTHFITMILPYINQEIENKNKIQTLLEYDFSEKVNEILEKITLKEETKSNIVNINWSNIKVLKSSNIEKIINRDKGIKFREKNLNIIISGSNKYIQRANEIINKVIEKGYINKNVTIINCYEVEFFNNNVREILEEHEFILNTSGLNRIEEVFEGYKKRNEKKGG